LVSLKSLYWMWLELQEHLFLATSLAEQEERYGKLSSFMYKPRYLWGMVTYWPFHWL
jgi:hypothetical protein